MLYLYATRERFKYAPSHFCAKTFLLEGSIVKKNIKTVTKIVKKNKKKNQLIKKSYRG